MNEKAIILLSGGVDSAVCLALAQKQGFECFALSFNYNQRNQCELHYAVELAKKLGCEHSIVNLPIGNFGGSALTDRTLKMDSPQAAGLLNTYVPARNTLFLATALVWAEILDAYHLFFGANYSDYVQYPDCRPEYFSAFTHLANLATRSGAKAHYQIHTPLIELDKMSIYHKALELGIDLSWTFSCYDPDSTRAACHQCLACQLRDESINKLNFK